MIFEALRWLGLAWDEGPDAGGPHGPTARASAARSTASTPRSCVRAGAAYRCFCTRERLDALREEQKAKKQNSRLRRPLPRDRARGGGRGAAGGEAHVVRLAMPREGQSVVHDLLRGDVAFETPRSTTRSCSRATASRPITWRTSSTTT